MRVLLVALCLSLVALFYRSRVQAFITHSDPAHQRGELAPELPSSLRTLDGAPIKLASFRGRVVLLHFWTFACGNCEHMVPYYNAWHDKYPGLAIIGVHTPELPSERNVGSLRQVVVDKKIKWTVVPDGGEVAWDAFGVKAWPTSFVLDKDGVIRGTFVGDDAADDIERLVTQLLR